MLTCKDATRLVSESQERTLGFRERWALRVHLWMCDNCRRFERQIRLLRKAMRIMVHRSDSESPAVELPAEARERIRKAIAERDPHSR